MQNKNSINQKKVSELLAIQQAVRVQQEKANKGKDTGKQEKKQAGGFGCAVFLLLLAVGVVFFVSGCELSGDHEYRPIVDIHNVPEA